MRHGKTRATQKNVLGTHCYRLPEKICLWKKQQYGKQERKEGEQEGHNAPGADPQEGAEKSQQCRMYFPQYNTFTPKRP